MPPQSTRPARRLPWLLATLVALACAAPAAAQTITGRIDGRVSDSSGAVLPGATITIVNTGTGLTTTQVTDDNGTYTATNLPVGSYTVSAELEGFRRAQRTGLQLGADRPPERRLRLGRGPTERVGAGPGRHRRGGQPHQRRGGAHDRPAADSRSRLQRPQLPRAGLVDPRRGRDRLRSLGTGDLAERHRPVDQRQSRQHQQPDHRRHVQRRLRLERVTGQQRQPQLHRRGQDPDVELLR